MSAKTTNPADLAPLTPAELARVAAVSVSTARRLISSGKVKPVATDLLGRDLYLVGEIEALRAIRWLKVKARFMAVPPSAHRILS